MSEKVELEVGGSILSIETGDIARQASGSVLVKQGDSIVLGTATMSEEPREGVDFFPLVCDYEERKYAVGKIPGGFVKRGGRPSEKAVVTSRLIDRPLRPLFPEGMRNEVQIICMPLSYDPEHPTDVLAIIAASAALSISPIPFNGPIGAVRIGRIDGEFVVNPSLEQLEISDLNLVVAGTFDAVTTVDADANQVPEEEILAGVDIAHEHIKQIVGIQNELVRRIGQPKAEVPLFELDSELFQDVDTKVSEKVWQVIHELPAKKLGKAERADILDDLRAELIESLIADYPEREIEVAEAVDKIIKREFRSLIINERIRMDGRRPDEIRPISAQVGLLPRVHGSGLFTRGQTQVLTTVTLGSLDEAQIVDSLEEDGTKRYMHFYNFPPFSVGETRPLRGPGRREIGHGQLAEKALAPMIPSEEDFPYAILLTSEVLESSGSTSMASVCGSTLSLMDAGVPIKAPVAGVAMGLMTDGTNYVILSDIMDLEDFAGDMDFKVAGTATGVTALQMDTKISGIPREVLSAALEQARVGRLYILDKMLETISKPREELSPYAPRVLMIEIHPDKIGDVIGPGGKIIKKIEAETGASINIEQDGRVYITAVDKAGGERALKMIDDIARDVKVGETYPGKVTRITPFGAFVEILPGREGLLHISQIGPARIARVEDVLHVGDEVLVKVIEATPQGKISLTRKGVVQPGEGPKPERFVAPTLREPQKGREKDIRSDKGRSFLDDDEFPRAKFRPKR
ncbi:MAG: polyribonucleotide nucleotidyltransferase [Armatimonadota bacterium]|nr:polyribonucleotide nucleotidyltransferase [Armatimonadota bacterium]